MKRALSTSISQTIPDAVELLEARIRQLAASGFLTGGAGLNDGIKRAAVEMAHDHGTRAVPLTEERQDAFLLALAAGLSVSAAAALAGVARRTLYDHRDRDSEFSARWDNALEASIGQIEARLETIALQGEMGSMATVRAAEALLRARQREPRSARDSIKVKNGAGEVLRIIWPDDGLTPE